MNKLFTLISIFFYSLVNAQVENGLQFDGTDDFVTVANASALISGSTNISMSCWINPQHASPVFPAYDGFCGFRNDVDADFYIVQTSATNIEARFRNSTGAAFDINSTALQINTWQHYVLTYDGSYMRLYHNGFFVDSSAATGSITSTAETFYIGDLIYSFNNFYLHGTLDEVSLWNTTLAPADINCIYKSYIDSTSSGLQLYYRFNQGIAGASNNGVDTLNPSTGSLYGVLNNFAYSGQQSNWVPGKQNYYTSTNVICPGNSITFGTQTLTQPGLYFESFTSVTGCDSIVRLQLYPVLSDSVTIFQDSIRAYQSNATYQWLDCNSGNAPIAGETHRSFTPTVSGNYAVEVSYNNCTDTSACVYYTPVGIDNTNSTALSIYPNPVNGVVIFNQALQNAEITITDISGRTVFSQKNFCEKKINVSLLNRGTYFINIHLNGHSLMKRFIKS